MRREVPDRVPWALWGHFPAARFLGRYSWEKATRDGEENARAHMALLRELDHNMDLLKVTPFYRYMAMAWGSRFSFTDNDEHEETVEVAVKEPVDWGRLWVLDPRRELREHLRTVEVLARDLRRMPFIYTIPSPIIQAMNGVGTPERVLEDMGENPDALGEGLETITQTCIDFARECVAEGASGIFFGIGGGGRIWRELTVEQLEDYAYGYDRRVLEAVDCPIKLMHVCSTPQGNPQERGLMEGGWFRRYPVTAINWDSHEFTPIGRGKEVYGGDFCVVGGLDRRETMRRGTPEQVEEQVRGAIEAAGEGGGFILGPGCTLYQDTPLASFNAVGRAVERYGRYGR